MGVEAQGKMNEQRLIRKYVNRRLYDTVQSRYVNLDDLQEIIVKGSGIRVVEQATGQDITTTVLLQIIAEHQRGGPGLLTADFLLNLIRLGDNAEDAELPGRLEKALKSAVPTVGLRNVSVTGSTLAVAAAAR
jgi:polyhydroxyalkanoate synthesis repressor PhaR